MWVNLEELGLKKIDLGCDSIVSNIGVDLEEKRSISSLTIFRKRFSIFSRRHMVSTANSLPLGWLFWQCCERGWQSLGFGVDCGSQVTAIYRIVQRK